MTITLTDHSTVSWVEGLAYDEQVTQAAKVSTEQVRDEGDARAKPGLINYLMKNRHGSPFEHGFLKWYVKAPIFVFREFHRHRIGFSYNEMSGRYTELLPEFYSPPPGRPLVQTGSSAHPSLQMGAEPETLWAMKRTSDEAVFQRCWDNYQAQLEWGIAKEMARTVLPVAVFSQMYVSCNPRSLMSFLSLRVKDDNAMFPSNPQWEINRVADVMEAQFKELMPHTHRAFIDNGRVAP